MSTRYLLGSAALLALSLSASAATMTTIALDANGTTSYADPAGAIYSLTATQPAGSGVFLPFMRIQHQDNAQGYNSSDTSTMDLINLPGNSSSTLAMSNVVTDDKRVFLTLDYNEQGAAGKSLITLEDLVLVVSTDPNKTGPLGPKNNQPWSVQSMPLSAGDQVLYQMQNFNLQLNADNNAANGNGGSGAADLTVDLNLAGVSNLDSLLGPGHYLYVYSRFSGTGAGFEEWNSFEKVLPNGGTGTPPPPVPEPASLGLLALGAAGLLLRRRA